MSGALALEQLHAGGEHELRQLGAVDRRAPACRPAPARRRCRSRRGVAWSAFSDEKQMPFSLWPSSLRSLSLAVTTATLAPASANAASIVPRAQVLRVVHHHFGAGVAVAEVVAADAVHGRRRAGDDRQVVRVGEATAPRSRRSGGAAWRGCARASGRGLPRPRCDVVGLAAVDADDDGGLLRRLVAPAVDGSVMRLTPFLPARARAGAGAPPRRAMHALRLSITWSNIARPAASASPEAIALTICAMLASRDAAAARRRCRLRRRKSDNSLHQPAVHRGELAVARVLDQRSWNCRFSR